MVVFNYSGKEVSAKVVYYGPGLSGKTTNLEWIYGKVPETQRGKMVSMKTKTDRTLFFDFLPLSAGEINGFRTRFLLYTVPGQVYYNATRKLVLKGADGIVFVADSDPQLRQANKESLANLEKNLNEYGTSIDQIPIVLQYNKRDLPQALPLEELNADLNPRGLLVVPAVAIRGEGVFETFKEITRLVFQKMHDRFEKAGPRPTSVPPMSGSRDAEPARSTTRVPAGPEAASAAKPAAAAVGKPAAAVTASTRGPMPPHASADEVIHLSTIDQILAGRKGAPAEKAASPQAAAAPAPVAAQPPVAQAAPAAPQPPLAPVAQAASSVAPTAAAPAASLEIEPVAPRAAATAEELTILPPTPAAPAPTPRAAASKPARTAPAPAHGAENAHDSHAHGAGLAAVVEHRVRVPVVIPGPIQGRLRLILEVDIREGEDPTRS
jgi:signal recognition particle receptor subunit beta